MNFPTDGGTGQSSKNSLEIRLTEPAIFLRSNGVTVLTDDKPSILRGLLVLCLVKPTKITSIDIELLAQSHLILPEVVGARRITVAEEHCLFKASTVFFQAGGRMRRANSIGPGVAYGSAGDIHYDDWEEMNGHGRQQDDEDEGGRVATQSPPIQQPIHTRVGRHLSVDVAHYQRHHVTSDERLSLPLHAPSYTSLVPSNLTLPDIPPSSPTNYLTSDPDLVHDTGGFQSTLTGNGGPLEVSPSRPSSSGQNVSTQRLGFAEPLGFSPEDDEARQQDTSETPRHRSLSRGTHQGRIKSGLTLAAVSNVLMDAVRSGAQRERSHGDQRSLTRGRTTEKRHPECVSSPTSSMAPRSMGKNTLLGKVGEVLRLEFDDHKENENWKEFKKGTYTYPISFEIPGNSPPSMQCDYGTLTWRLQAHVHRPGAFRPKYTAWSDVIVVSSPAEDDIEESDNIIIERQWDQQLEYLVTVFGRGFCIGNSMPITFAVLPLQKVKIYRIAVYLEEHVDYYIQMQHIAHSEPINLIELVCIRHPGKNAPPILPLESDDPDAFIKSPLYEALASQLNSDSDNRTISDLASTFMGPGPWSFHLDLKLPNSCKKIKPTCKNKRANMTVTHVLKIVMRMERGDDLYLDKTGKKKLFDLVIQTSINILSCRCNPEYISLPCYSQFLDVVGPVNFKCPCDNSEISTHGEGFPRLFPHHQHVGLERHATRNSSSSNEVSSAESVQANSTRAANLFERLVSGQETEYGETPPAYESTVHLAVDQ